MHRRRPGRRTRSQQPGDGDDRRARDAHRRRHRSSSTRCARHRRSLSSPATGPASWPPSSTRPAPVPASPATSSTARPASTSPTATWRRWATSPPCSAWRCSTASPRIRRPRITRVCCPRSIVGPVVNFVDTARPIVAAIGPQDLGTGSWSYAKVTQHTQVGVQAGEKTELASRKMTITKTPLAPDTYGGYVNVSQAGHHRELRHKSSTWSSTIWPGSTPSRPRPPPRPHSRPLRRSAR